MNDLSLKDRPMRRDAQLRREALVDAAALCFAEEGFGVSLEAVAERAGVGRGTFYRNFRDRMGLVLAVFERQIDALAKGLSADVPLEQAITELVYSGARFTALLNRLSAEMPLEGANLSAFKALASRIEVALEPVAERARAEGRIRSDVTAHDLLISARMVAGLLHAKHSAEEIRTLIAEGLELLMRGLSPR